VSVRRPDRAWPILPRAFFARPTIEVARDLLGKVLVHHASDGITSGAIVEVEAYIGEDDPACHAAHGPTRRNAPLYGEPGCAYVYFNYGVHYLVNAVTEPAGVPAAVLIRALEPVDGVDLMHRRRGPRNDGTARAIQGLCRGPGNLTRAMGIGADMNTADLTRTAVTGSGPKMTTADLTRTGGRGPKSNAANLAHAIGDGPEPRAADGPTSGRGLGRLWIEDRGIAFPRIAWTPRIGIRVGTDRLWRCCVSGHPAVSGRRFRGRG
jgi:DNA-3-methyladenine glycosylase